MTQHLVKGKKVSLTISSNSTGGLKFTNINKCHTISACNYWYFLHFLFTENPVPRLAPLNHYYNRVIPSLTFHSEPTGWQSSKQIENSQGYITFQQNGGCQSFSHFGNCHSADMCWPSCTRLIARRDTASKVCNRRSIQLSWQQQTELPSCGYSTLTSHCWPLFSASFCNTIRIFMKQVKHNATFQECSF